MYQLANRITPEQLYWTARQAFGEMLAGGFTSVAEFHYLHHLPDGSPTADMGMAVVNAAQDAGIRLVMLPVMYQQGGFGQPPSAVHRRFVHESVVDFLGLLESLKSVPLGLAPHSLRAFPPDRLPGLIKAVSAVLGDEFPIHIHVSEQQREVAECIKNYGAGPIELLASTVDLGPRWNLVHATHASTRELELMLEARVNTIVCPITEAYLGDGIFRAADYMAAGGTVAIGSDSNVRIDGIEELRWLEYGQRLESERRSILATSEGLGLPLWQQVCRSGALALGLEIGALEPGCYADLIVLDDAPLRAPHVNMILDALIVGGSAGNIIDVYVGGQRRVHRGKFVDAGEIARHFESAVESLLSNKNM